MTISSFPPMQDTIVAERYRVERLLGQGGMGSVWVGRHLSLDQRVAIKFIHPKLAASAVARKRFDIEARAAAKIQSRYAVRVYDHGVTEDGTPYIVMEYLEGQSLEDRILERGALAWDEMVYVIAQAARALHVAHRAGIIHRDLKPDNIFLATDLEAGRRGYTVKLVDFGIAKMVEPEAVEPSNVSQAGLILGTPYYMSPESLTGAARVEPASDLWSLGACAFTAACGSVPFDGESIGDVALKVCASPLPVPSQVNANLPKAFDAWFAKACARDAARRFGNAREMAEALINLSLSSEPPVPEGSATELSEPAGLRIRPQAPSGFEFEALPDTPRTPIRSRVLAGVLVALALSIGAFGWYMAQRARDRQPLNAESPGSLRVSPAPESRTQVP